MRKAAKNTTARSATGIKVDSMPDIELEVGVGEAFSMVHVSRQVLERQAFDAQR